jgi:hypothetical protein
MILTEYMKKMGLTEEAIYQEELSTQDNALIMSNSPDHTCPVKPVMKQTSSLDEYKEWMGGNEGEYQHGKPLLATPPLSVIPTVATKMHDLTAQQFQDLKAVTDAYVAGTVELNDSQKKIVETAFAPFKVAVYTARMITVTPDNPWIIAGPGPVSLHIYVVSVKPGGQIIISAPGRIFIENMWK